MKQLYFLLILVSLSFIFLFLKIAENRKSPNWKFFVKEQVGAKSELNIGKNLTFDEKSFYFNDGKGNVHSLNKKTGEINWLSKMKDHSPFQIMIDKDFLYIASFDGHIYCLNKKNGYINWSFAIPNQFWPDTEVIFDANDQFVFFADRAGFLYALNKKSGKEVWKKAFPTIDNSKAFVENSMHFGFIKQDEDRLFIKNYPSGSEKILIINKRDGSNQENFDQAKFEEMLAKSIENKTEINFNKQALWKKELPLIDSSKTFAEKLVHFGFIKQIEDAFIKSIKNKAKFNLSKEEIWKKEILLADNSKTFAEKLVHFGLSDQNKILINNYPSEKLKTLEIKRNELNQKNFEKAKLEKLNQEKFEKINKEKLEKESQEKFEKINKEKLEKEKIEELFVRSIKKIDELNFDKFSLVIEANAANQPILKCLDKNKNEIWSYRTEERINPREIYQDGNRLYFFNADNTILESIEISQRDPNENKLKELNFKIKENFSAHYPYKNSNPQIDSETKKIYPGLEIRKIIQRISFFFKNLKKITVFEISQQEQNDYLEFNIQHEQNFYKNVFTEIKIEAIFTNQEDNQKIKVKGFYYDNDLWKIRAKLKKGLWRWQVKIKTPYFISKKDGTFEISKDFSKQLQIKDGAFFTEDNEAFIPMGLQGVISDRSRDGNPLNKMDYAKDPTPPTDPKKYNFLTFTDYLDLYKKEAKMNIFRYGPDNLAPPIWQNLDNPKDFEMNVNGNMQGDYILNELKKRDFRAMMSIFAFYPPYISEEAFYKKDNQEVIKDYLDYVIARYASSIDIWELTNEAAPSLKWLNFVSNYLAENDPYKHPITTNIEEKKLDNSDLLSIHWYAVVPENNFELIDQANHIDSKQDFEKATIISEFGFKGSNYFNGSSTLLRKFVWISTFRKMGMIFWNTGDGFYKNAENGNIYLGPVERNILKNLSDFLPKLTYPTQKDSELISNQNLISYKLSDENWQLIYLLKIDEKIENKEVNLKLNLDNSGLLATFDPKTGEVLNYFEVTEGESIIKIPSFSDDLAIKIKYWKN